MIMFTARSVRLCIGLFIFLSAVSSVGAKNSLLEANSLPKVDQVKKEGLVSWESKPRLVDQGNGLQLLLQASEGMSFIYAARKGDGSQNLYYSSSHTMGDTFSKPYPISKGEVNSHGENGPILRQGPGIGRFAVWQGGNDLKFARSMNFGHSFTPAIKVNDDAEKTYHSFQTMEVGPKGTIYVAWLDGRGKDTNLPGTSSLYIARSFDQGTTFGKNIKIAGNVCPCCRPSLAIDESGKVYVSWRHVYKDHNRVVAVSSSQDNGETWSEKTLVTPEGWKINGCPHSGASMEIQDGNLFITWYSGVDNRAALRAGISLDEGKTFKYLGEVQGKVLDANHPDIQMINGEAWVVFQGRDPISDKGWGVIRPWILKISGEGKISQPQQVPFLGDSVAYPYLFKGTGGRIYATWTEISENGPKAVLCRGRIIQ